MYNRRITIALSSLYPLALLSRSYCSGESVTSPPSTIISFSPKEFIPFTISQISQISPDTKKFTISLPSANHETGMKVSSLVMIKGLPKDGKEVSRPYTPTTLRDTKGSFDLIVKAYPTGLVSSYLHSLKVGDVVEVKGPYPKLSYTANMKKRIGFIAGGSGITPMLQIILEVLKNPADLTELDLIFANHTEQDILLKDQLDELASKHKNFRVTYVLSRPSSSWKGYSGYINADILRRHLPVPDANTLVYTSGPPGFMKTISGDKTPDYKQGLVEGLLKDAGYTEEMVYKF